MVALGACGALEYTLDEGRCLDAMARCDQIDGSLLIVTVSKDGVFLDANEALCKWLNRSREAIIGARVCDFFPNEIAEARVAAVRQACESGNAMSYYDTSTGYAYEAIVAPVWVRNEPCDRALCITRYTGVAEDGTRELRTVTGRAVAGGRLEMDDR